MGRVNAGDVPLLGGIAPFKDAYAFLAQSEAEAAAQFGADWCRYSTGGSTHGNQTLALAVGQHGDRVIVSRTAHRSTLLGLILAGLVPVWVPAAVDEATGLPAGVDMHELAAAIEANPDAVGVFLTESSYVGSLSDLPAAVELAHQADMPVLVDQAWGAHFGSHPAYPKHAIAAGADAFVISGHKTLPVYSQGSIIVAKTERLDPDRLERAFDASATTSAAGSILASTDAGRVLLGSELCTRLLDDLLGVVAGARTRLRAAAPFKDAVIVEPSDFGPGRFDPAKLVILLAGTGLSGNEIEKEMIAAGLPLEMADRDAIIPIITIADDESTVDRLCTELIRIAEKLDAAPPRDITVAGSWRSRIPVAAMTPREAFFAPHETVPAESVLNRIAAEVICPYPPGVPVVVPGEVISREVLDALHTAQTNGVRIAYASDPTLATFQVVRDVASCA
ncbi:lysine decarboxylase [Nocardioides sp. J9]|nr:lysine decarboxylase [Nocardioides sp. J9]